MTPKPVVQLDLHHLSTVRLTVAEACEELADELPRVGRISFRRLCTGLAERLEIIVRFLAVLELYKQGVVELDQTETFGALTVTRLLATETLDAASIADWDLDVEERAAVTPPEEADETADAIAAQVDREIDAMIQGLAPDADDDAEPDDVLGVEADADDASAEETV
jgi:uncharacterized protein YciU (UPF0263 family)